MNIRKKIEKALKEVSLSNPIILFKEYFGEYGYWFEEFTFFPACVEGYYECNEVVYFNSKIKDKVKKAVTRDELINLIENRGYRFDLKENLMF